MIYAFINPDPVLTEWNGFDDRQSIGAGITQMLHSAELIPVTGRDETEVLLVPAAFTSWQVLLHGAVVVRPDGSEDPAWRRLTLDSQRRHGDAVSLAAHAASHISMFAQLDLDVTLLERNGAPLLVRATHPHSLGLALDHAAAAWQEWLADGPFAADLRLIRNGDELVLLPGELGTGSAVNYVLQALSSAVQLSVGVGAREADRSFLSLCDVIMTPGRSLTPWDTSGDLE